MEAFAVASSAAGLVSLGIEVCKGLLTYYQSWRTAVSDVAGMYTSIETLAKTLILLESVIKNGVFDQQIVKNVEKSILATATGLTSLKKKLDKIKFSNQEDKWTEKTRGSFRRVIYPLKQSVLVKLKELANELRDDLALAMSVLQMYVVVIFDGCNPCQPRATDDVAFKERGQHLPNARTVLFCSAGPNSHPSTVASGASGFYRLVNYSS